ncbi:MAG: DUF1232 domain-containing protein [Deltaproteobacteria bacterium]|nr:DUF1232 domain-containing protein [Deltaproteobacteria bacterium]
MTTDIDATCLETFPTWLRSLASDAEAMASGAASTEAPEAARRALLGGLNYLFKSIDLIPDGIDDLGYLDDAFVLRVAAAQALEAGLSGDKHPGLAALGAQASTVKEFLGGEYPRLEHYVTNLRKGMARGRSVDDVLSSPGTLAEFEADVRGFVRGYSAPGFVREERNLIRLRAFLDAKLPR